MKINIFFKAWKNYVNDIIATGFDVELVHNICCLNTSSHFYFWALVADLVVDPARSLGVVALMTPTATVCRMSLAAKRPRGGKSEKASTHMGLLSTSLTIASSPDLMNWYTKGNYLNQNLNKSIKLTVSTFRSSVFVNIFA